MARYLVKYLIIPPGVGPDDYESSDLEVREGEFEMPDPVTTTLKGEPLRMGPPLGEIHAVVEDSLAEGAHAIIQRTDLIDS
ncbi:hypothetical protein ACWD4Z_22755 [Streptomyces antibioticus]